MSAEQPSHSAGAERERECVVWVQEWGQVFINGNNKNEKYNVSLPVRLKYNTGFNSFIFILTHNETAKTNRYLILYQIEISRCK